MVSVLLGVRARGETTKTGTGQGTMPDFPQTREMLQRRKRNRGAKEKLFKISKARFSALWAEALARHGHAALPPHSIRHSGPSRDAFLGYRSLEQIKKRGRWFSKEAVRRYSKSHYYVQALAMLMPEDRELGEKLITRWGAREEVARD